MGFEYIAKLSVVKTQAKCVVRWCGWSLQKQIHSADSKERHCAGDLLGEMPCLLVATYECSEGYAASTRFRTSLVNEVLT
jgi:hypothetical protein